MKVHESGNHDEYSCYFVLVSTGAVRRCGKGRAGWWKGGKRRCMRHG